ncbi:hypothetical protein WN943_025744 [Citrus x changshan-huyou]
MIWQHGVVAFVCFSLITSFPRAIEIISSLLSYCLSLKSYFAHLQMDHYLHTEIPSVVCEQEALAQALDK